MADKDARNSQPSRAGVLAFVGSVLRRTRSERELLITIVAVVLVSAFVFASIPKLFNAMADDGIAHAVRITSSFERNIGMSRGIRIAPGTPDMYAPIDAEGQAFQDSLAPTIQSIIERRTYIVDAVQYRVVAFEGTVSAPSPRYITMRHQSEVEPHIRVDQGRRPAVTPETIEATRTVTGQSLAHEIPLIEIMISSETARQLTVGIGDRLVMEPQSTDTLARAVPRNQHRFLAVEIVGLLEVNDTDDEFWFGNPEIHRAAEYDDGNTIHFFATALIAPDAYAQIYAETPFAFRYGWRYFVNPDALDAGLLGQLSADVRRLDAQYGFATFARPEETTVRTGLSNVFRRYQSQRNLTEAILSMTSIGLLGVACAVIALVGALTAERHRETMSLMRSRGGSTRQLLLGQVAEGVVLSVPAAVAGFVVAVIVTDGRLTALSILATALIGCGTVALLALSAAPLARSNLGSHERAETPIRRTSARRIVLDASIIAVALLGVFLFRRRGLTGSSSTSQLNEFDPYLAAVPVLLGVATGTLVLRLYPLPVRLLALLTALRRDIVPALGFRRLARHRGASNLPLLVLLLSVAVAVFSSILLHTISDGQIESSWQRVGADYRVQPLGSGYLYRAIDMSAVPGIEEIAEAHFANDAQISGLGGSLSSAQFLAVDVDALARVNSDRHAAPEFPARLSAELPAVNIGLPENPIPAIVSPTLAGRALAPGDVFSLTVIGRDVTFEVVSVRERFPGLSVERSFVVASRGQVQQVNPGRMLRTSWLLMRAPDDAHEAIVEVLSAQSQSAMLLSRAEEYARVHESPLIAGVQGGYRIGLVVTALYAALAVVIAMTLSAHERTRDYGLLRTLGLSKAQVAGLTVIEFVPPFAIAVGAGLALGIGVARLIAPVVDLTAFTGPGIPVALRIDWLTVVALMIGLMFVIGGAIAAATAITGRASLGRVLRVGE
ncbi:MAG TPA: FtsX-like permease family protein [Thermomicrobiales bacterium]|nr:FtsX-like permease family protein [Thermomicrobiales bacterium]